MVKKAQILRIKREYRGLPIIEEAVVIELEVKSKKPKSGKKVENHSGKSAGGDESGSQTTLF